jgi:tRNA nucleotidyltransferase (CCA-adding enzyme)
MVTESSIKQDLHRRDFTINTLAIRLDPQRWGELLDFYGGRSDLEEGVIRVLHSLSFVDDPTRILRAARFEARLGFRIDERSEALIAEALPLLDRITGERIRHEYDLIFREAEPEAVLDRLEALGALRQLHPDLSSDAWLKTRFRRLREAFEPDIWGMDMAADGGFLHWSLLLYRLNRKGLTQVALRLKLSRRIVDVHERLQALRETVTQLSAGEQPSAIANLLDPYDLESLAVAWLASGDEHIRGVLLRYATTLRDVKPILNGNDLKEMSFEPGPIFRKILGTLRDARLDGQIETREDEVGLVKSRFTPKT